MPHAFFVLWRWADEKINQWSNEVTADCLWKQGNNLNDVCSARCPDLPRWFDSGDVQLTAHRRLS